MNEVANRNINKHPLGSDFGSHYPIVQYVDDTLIIMPVDALQLFYLKGLLRSFVDSTRLKVNFNRSFIVPINITNEKCDMFCSNSGVSNWEYAFHLFGISSGNNQTIRCGIHASIMQNGAKDGWD